VDEPDPWTAAPAESRVPGSPSQGVPGSYLVLMELERPTTLQIGRLGRFGFPAGRYLYAGSAMGGLEQRVERHLRPSPVRRWHLDYLRAEARVRGVVLFPSGERLECELAATLLSLPGAAVPAPRFGASDCRCRSHLVHLPSRADT
jgi:Uri superfamily endonuclease